MCGSVSKFFDIVRGASACAAQGIGWADDSWKADFSSDGECFFEGVGESAFGEVEANFAHGFLKGFAVFRFFNGVWFCADHFDIEFFECSLFVQGHGGIEARLPTQCWEEGIWAFFFDDRSAYFRCDGLEVCLICHFGVGHDGGGIAVDQHDFVSLFFEGFAGLRAGVVKFTGLSDDNGTRADEHYFFEVGSFGHKELSGKQVVSKSCAV